MADNVSTKNQVKEITDRLEQGVKELFESDKYKAYLKTMSRFPRYSTRNTLLIHMQMPEATRVAGYRTWEKDFGRYVMKGERGIRIFAPSPFTVKKEQQVVDPDTNRPVMGPDGLPLTEEVEKQFARFKVISVFDVSQTDGKPLPSLVEDLTGDVRHYELFMDTLRAVSPLPIGFEALGPDTDGVCRYGNNIAIREGMSEIQTVSAAIHEIAHARLHDINSLREQDETVKPKDRRTKEVEAESVSYAVCQYYGIETGANSFGYLAEWSKSRDLKELNASLDTIRKAAADLIEGIDKHFLALAKERGIDLTVELPAQEPSPEQDVPVKEPEVSVSQPEPQQPENTTAHRNYRTLVNLAPEVIEGKYYYMCFQAGEAFMPLTFENIGGNRFALMHYYMQDGDMMRDPDMELIIDHENHTVNAMTFTQHPAIYQEVGEGQEGLRLQRELNSFLTQWLKNIGQQGYELESARYYDENDKHTVYFGADKKPFEIGMGHMGNGLTVWNRLEEVDGDYKTIAHIGADRSVTYYEDNLPPAVKERIENEARTSEMTVSATQDTPVFDTPPYDELTMQSVDREVRAILQMFIDNDLEAHGKLMESTLESIAVQGYEYRDGKLEIAVKEQAPLPEKQPGYEEWSEAATAENAPDQPGVASDDVSVYLPEPEADTDADYLMPDPAIGLSERDLYGYTGEDILPLTQARAQELFAQDMTVYMLYPDNTEAMVFDGEEIAAHDGIFGIDAGEWRESPEYKRMDAERSEGTREAALLYGEGNAFGIYQLKGGDELHYHRFTPLDQMEKEGLTVDRANYELVYTAPLTERIEFLTDRYPALNKIYDTFNTQHPEDFTGHSLSVSDVIVLKYNGDYSSHFVDSVGFVEIDAFLGGEARHEQAAEAPAPTSSQVGNMSQPPLTDGPTVAELKAEVDAGRKISLTALANAVHNEHRQDARKERPSLLAQLQEYKNNAAQGADSTKTAPKHDVNREV